MKNCNDCAHYVSVGDVDVGTYGKECGLSKCNYRKENKIILFLRKFFE